MAAVLSLALAPALLAAQQREEIVSYDVLIEVQDGNRMVVTEEITVRSLGQEIRRGIFRDFPTSFPSFLQLTRIEAPFEVLEVQRDGMAEPWTVERIGGPWGRGGARIRIGSADVFLQNGLHAYTIRYETARWMGFGEDIDELYWNVTGNGWEFPIRQASARVMLPRPVDPADVELSAWTGPEGATTSDATAAWDVTSGEARFETTRELDGREGLTISVIVPKGVVLPASEADESLWFRADWGAYIQAGFIVLVLVALYIVLWVHVGRDPPQRPVMVRYDPPEGYSPAALGYLAERGWDDRHLSASLVSLAVHGALSIEQDEDEWTLRRDGEAAPAMLAPEELRLLEGLLGPGSSMRLSSSYSSKLRSAVKKLRSGLKARLERQYFVLNRHWFAAGLATSVLGLILLAVLDPYGVPFPAWFLMFWLSMWTIGAGTLFVRCIGAWRAAFRGGGFVDWIGALVLTAFSTPFFVAEIVVAVLLLLMVPRSLAGAAVLIGLVNVVFYHLLERPTLKGRGVLDSLEGFKRFLTATEADRLDRTMPPDRTPKLFEQYLPYAIALGVENRWAESFEGVLGTGSVSSDGAIPGSPGSSAMSWYSGSRSSDFSGLASSLGRSFSDSLSSASSPPASSGGGSSGGSSGFSSGGGSSGGGGGGGGGGGW